MSGCGSCVVKRHLTDVAFKQGFSVLSLPVPMTSQRTPPMGSEESPTLNSTIAAGTRSVQVPIIVVYSL